jgi:predicted GNAT family acetyltransferase
MDIRDERAAHRYSAYQDGRRIGHIAYVPVGDTVAVPHLHMDPAYRDLGIGSTLARRLVQDARVDGLRVLALCPFMRRWAQLHPGYRDVLRYPRPGELGMIENLVALTEFEEERELRSAPDGGTTD